MSDDQNSWRPNPGPQERFLSCMAFEALYGGSAGGGKIQRLDSVVWTPFGSKPIGELKANDQVCAPDGGVTRVVLAHPVQLVDLYRLTFSDGASAIVGGEHLWYSWRSSRKVKAERRFPHGTERRRGKVETTLQLIKYIEQAEKLEAKGKKGHRPIIPLCEPVCLTPPRGRWENPRTVPPYTLGALLGDGTITPPSKQIAITGIDPMIMWEIGLELPDHGIRQFDSKTWKIGKWRSLFEQLKALGALGYSHTKAVPRCYQLAPLDVRLAVLQGLMDTDGTVDSRGHASFTSTSEQLTIDVQWLARSLGYKATKSYGGKGKYRNSDGEIVVCRDHWDIYIQGHNMAKLFRLPRKVARCRSFNGGYSEPGRRLEGVEYVGRDEARCITVDHPSGLYLTDDFIVTHNSEALLMGATRFVDRPGYRALMLRRTYPELKRSLIDRSEKLYPRMGATYNTTDKVWTFPGGGKIEFGAIEREPDVRKYASAEYQQICFDELTTFTKSMYLFLISRLRSTTGIPLLLRGATNPGGGGHSWVLNRFAPWLYPEGHREYKGPSAKPEERMYFTVADDDNGNPIDDWCGPERPKSRARVFFPARVHDNPFLAGTDYEDNLALLDNVTRRQLRDGDWLVKPAAGLYFKRDWFETVDRCPSNVVARVRYWDRASSKKETADRTAGVRLSRTAGGLWFVEDVNLFRGRPHEVEQEIKITARRDLAEYGIGDPYENKTGVHLFLEQDPGAAGAFEAEYYVRELAEFASRFVPPQGNKIVRAQPVSAQAEGRMIMLVRGDWNHKFLEELEEFPDGHDDQMDSTSGAFRQALYLAELAQDKRTDTIISADQDDAEELSEERKGEAVREREAWSV